jgi:hypothetical protein
MVSEGIMIQGTWKSLDLFRKPQGLEAAGAIMVDEQGARWVQLYLVWQKVSGTRHGVSTRATGSLSVGVGLAGQHPSC